ncbi:MAG: hypothetical protein F6J86_23675 [Symploca sp. SIO1B1]|nr:hypothetical protein [Symploca sp. SIO1C2]NER96810.1 hypothetical protein [Symploca sp. SIO1B1]
MILEKISAFFLPNGVKVKNTKTNNPITAPPRNNLPTFRTLNCHTTNFGCLKILTQVIAYDTSVADLLAAALALSQNDYGNLSIKSY